MWFSYENMSNGKNLSKNEAIVIEFVGPPGSGKTTNCRQFVSVLQQKGIIVLTLQQLKDYIHDASLTAKFYLLMKTLFLKSYVLARYVYVLAQYNIFSINSIYRYLRLLIFEQALEKVIRSRKIDIVLLDQWSIQEIWSATIFRSKAYDLLPGCMCKFYFETDYTMYFDIDMHTASERISERQTNLSRFDRMDPEKRLTELEKYNTYLHRLFEMSDCNKKYTFCTAQPPYIVAEQFVQHLELTTIKKV